MVNIITILSNFQRWSLIGHDDKLLSVDAIQEPGEHLFRAKTGAQRELLTPPSSSGRSKSRWSSRLNHGAQAPSERAILCPAWRLSSSRGAP